MEPYYQDEWVTIYHGDCREILPQLSDKSADLVLTDPPYGVGKTYDSYSDTKANLIELIDVIFSIPIPKLVTPGIGNIWYYPPADWVLCWYKPNCMTRAGVANANTWEPILVYACKGFGVDSIKVPIVPQHIDHPCPKPIALWDWLIVKATRTGATILDPFLGSGTTCYCAKKLNRRCIGIEIEENYCEIAANRCRQMVFNLESVT